jgi:endoglucanase
MINVRYTILSFIYLSLISGLVAILVYLYRNSPYNNLTRTFSPYTVLSSSWEKYKLAYMNKEGRVIDYKQNSTTTSEGQSYALLRAVWLDDKTTFDLTWKWTKENLHRPSDHLFGWRWGLLGNNHYGFLANGGGNTASDADQDIAFALLLAGKRWRQTAYISDAIPIINDIWDQETVATANGRYLIAGNWAKTNQVLVINPSYFAPYEWRLFATVDPDHNWLSLINPAYTLLENATLKPLDKNQSAGLPPDWLVYNLETNDFQNSGDNNLNTDYAFDAIRIPWRVAIDYLWYQEPLAYKYLSDNFSQLQKDYGQKQMIASAYTHDGKPILGSENPAMYATAIAYFMVSHPNEAASIYQAKLINNYSNDTNSFNPKLDYYSQNWLWFGIALYNHFLFIN